MGLTFVLIICGSVVLISLADLLFITDNINNPFSARNLLMQVHDDCGISAYHALMAVVVGMSLGRRQKSKLF